MWVIFIPISDYGVLKGKAKDKREGQGKSPHFHVKVSDQEKFRIAVNVKSQVEPSTLLYYIDENFDHPILKYLQSLPNGFKKLNQGNAPQWKEDDGPWQDGGLIFHFPDENRWVTLFTAFQSQCFHTDDVTGHRISEACDVPAADGRVCIVAALVNPLGTDKGLETGRQRKEESSAIRNSEGRADYDLFPSWDGHYASQRRRNHNPAGQQRPESAWS